jgi:hypothetical protein
MVKERLVNPLKPITRWLGRNRITEMGKKRGKATFLAVSVDALVFGVWCRYKKK